MHKILLHSAAASRLHGLSEPALPLPTSISPLLALACAPSWAASAIIG